MTSRTGDHLGEESPRVVGAVLAARAGSRMGRPKAELELHGRRLVDRAVEALTAGGCESVLVVAPSGVEVPGATVIINAASERGLRSSLELAVGAVPGHLGPGAALAVALVDMPSVDASIVRAVIGARGGGRIAIASYAGVLAPPTVMSVPMWREVLRSGEADDPDRGAGAFVAAHPDLVDAVLVEAELVDLDTAQDLSSWLADQP